MEINTDKVKQQNREYHKDLPVKEPDLTKPLEKQDAMQVSDSDEDPAPKGKGANTGVAKAQNTVPGKSKTFQPQADRSSTTSPR